MLEMKKNQASSTSILSLDNNGYWGGWETNKIVTQFQVSIYLSRLLNTEMIEYFEENKDLSDTVLGL